MSVVQLSLLDGGADAFVDDDTDDAAAAAAARGEDPKPVPAEPMSLEAMLLGHVQFLINTPPVAEVLTEFYEWLLGGLLGGAIVSRPRQGKTRCGRFCLKAIPSLLGFKIPWVEVPLRKMSEKYFKSEDDFFAYLLSRVDHLEKRGSTCTKRNRFVDFCVAQAKRSKSRMFIIFIDEAQKLSTLQLTWLLECSNEVEVEEKSVRIFLLFAAQTEFKDLKADLVKAGGTSQFVQRFMTAVHEFRGIQSEEELTVCLKNYATKEYPLGSGKPFTSNYLDTAPNPNLDVSTLAPIFWYEFGLIWKARLGNRSMEIGMHYVSAGLIRFLIYRRDPKYSLESDGQLVHDAVGRILFSDAVEDLACSIAAGAV